MTVNSLLKNQLTWVTLVTCVISIGMTILKPNFYSSENLFNISRNASLYAIMAIGQSWVLLTGGIDLSVGSVMCISGIVIGLLLSLGFSFTTALLLALACAVLCGFINGLLIARYKLSGFIVTLGMLSIARSLALIISDNKMFYEFGPDEEIFLKLGSYQLLGLSGITWICILLVIFSSFILRKVLLGRYLYAIGGNESACIACGVPIIKTKIIAYIFCSLMAGISGILSVAWLGSATTSLGAGEELTVIAATVLGGFKLTGGHGVAWGVLVGALLIELIRNSLLLLGVPSFWQGSVVGLILIGAVAIERLFHNSK